MKCKKPRNKLSGLINSWRANIPCAIEKAFKAVVLDSPSHGNGCGEHNAGEGVVSMGREGGDEGNKEDEGDEEDEGYIGGMGWLLDLKQGQHKVHCRQVHDLLTN